MLKLCAPCAALAANRDTQTPPPSQTHYALEEKITLTHDARTHSVLCCTFATTLARFNLEPEESLAWL